MRLSEEGTKTMSKERKCDYCGWVFRKGEEYFIVSKTHISFKLWLLYVLNYIFVKRLCSTCASSYLDKEILLS